MKRKVIVTILIMILLVVACTPIKPPLITATPTPPTYLRPLTAVWDIVDDGLMQQGSLSISIQAIYLYSRATLLFFTLSGKGFDVFSPGFAAQIMDNTGASSRLLRVISFGTMESLSVGMMVFEPRRAGALKLTLTWPNMKGSAPVNFPLAVFYGKSNEDNLNRQYFAATEKKVEQNGFLISFGWGLDIDPARMAAITTTPPPDSRIAPIPMGSDDVMVPLMKLTPGASVLRECSFTFEDLIKGQVKRIGIQLLVDDDRIIARMDGRVWLPEPLIIITPTPTPAPTGYPPP